MPAPRNPRKKDFYVYRFKVADYPFYVGVGRAERASDRLRYVKSLMVPKNRTRLASKSLSVRVMAALLKRGEHIRWTRTRFMTRSEALRLEKKTINRLVSAGFLLANWQHNPSRHNNTAKAVGAIISRRKIRKP